MTDAEPNAIDCETEHPGEYPHVLRVRAHTFRADVIDGSTDSAPGAHDYFDAALATCKAHTAIFYAKRKGIPLERVVCRVERDDSEERSGVYRLQVRIEFEGPLTDEHRVLLHRAVGKCPIHKLMTTSEVAIELAP